ncbi:beta-1,4-N-acetylgalactosaminyltransferase bre-4-like [Haemaphysalis longicornis]
MAAAEIKDHLGIATRRGALPWRKVCKWVPLPVAVFVLLNIFFDMTTLKKSAVKDVAPNISWIKNELFYAHSANSSSFTMNEISHLKGVPEDVLTDGGRTNTVASNICPLVPPNLVGYIGITRNVSSLEAVEAEFPDVRMGGSFQPKDCTPRHRVAILVPYRNRAENLKVLIYNLNRVLANQQIDYGIFVIEQGDDLDFNRGKLLNVGVKESTILHDYQCFVFHDVDLVPVDDRNVYTCPEHPRHMSVRIDNRSGVPYERFFGGVGAVNKEHMMRLNGFSNRYWGWGGEDDDMANRLKELNLKIHRRPADVARYASLKHAASKPNKQRWRLLKAWKQRYMEDGLNSLHYKRLDLVFKKLYTWILVDLREP